MSEATEQQNTQKSQGGGSVASNKYLWAIGAIILLLVGWFGIKTVISPYEDYKLTLVDAPKDIYAGVNAAFTWRIDGQPTTVTSTSVYMGTTSNPGDLKKDVKPSDTKYTDFVKDFANGKYDIPLQFVGNHIINTAGKYYYRVYALIKDKNYWSDEYTLNITSMENKVILLNIPKEFEANSISTFTWKVEGSPNVINATTVYYGLESTPGGLDTNIIPAATKYTDNIKDFANGKYNIPLQFIGNVKIATAGSYFYRGYAVIDGKNYWTDEGGFKVLPVGAIAKQQAEKLTPTTTVKPTEKKAQ
jgi:hypothetical protein